ncbi:hypothetical protein Vadar_021159 [Vaccinium darrowii]|uniref:Uncharacterized protein n=1 Tax=Vaccinium darrowii TaxID=229202 RepID=A0ACB7Y979_9ERIC|nr:hypothetical protein Vadar_021159 [Vaccinium darrowii]
MIFVIFASLFVKPWAMGHVLRDCTVAKAIWADIRIPSGSVASFSLSPSSWLKSNCESKIIHCSGIPWSVVFPFTCWNIWLLRNNSLFNPNPSRADDLITSTTKATFAQAIEWHFIAIPELVPRSKHISLVKWHRPSSSFFKLNTDGAFKKDLGQATGGGLIRDEEGNWIIGFHRHLRASQSLEAEFWALRDGLLLAQNNHLVPISVEMDALAAIQLLADSNLGIQSRHYLNNIIHDCRCLMRQLGVMKIDHIYREGNKCADLLAKMSFNDALDFHIFDVAPTCINSQLCDNKNGVAYPRLLHVS